MLAERGALDVYVLPPTAGANLIVARERAFYVSKAAGADDLVDTVVPRAAIPGYLATVAELAAAHGALGLGLRPRGRRQRPPLGLPARRRRRRDLVGALIAEALAVGGAISGEHGIGIDKQPYFLELEDPVKLALMRAIKAAFDPHGILGPGRLLDPPAAGDVAEGG